MPSAKPSHFFSATQSVETRIGEMFSFLWASYIGLRELYWQVRGFRGTFPSLTISDLEKKFMSGLPRPGGIDLVDVCIDTGWPEHEQSFGKWLLFEVCTLYEGWAEKVCTDLFPQTSSGKYSKKLQFPETKSGGAASGYMVAVNAANASTSKLIKGEFFPQLQSNKLNRWSSVNEHLIAYRFFKECRNALIHSDGLVTQEIVTWHQRLTVVQSNTPSPFKHPFALPIPVLQQPLLLNLRDCTLFATVAHRLMATFDAALCVARKSEALLEMRLRAVIAQHPKWKSFPANSARREQRVHRLLVAARIPEPRSTANLLTWMSSRGLI